jgi:hypothetical protein
MFGTPLNSASLDQGMKKYSAMSSEPLRIFCDKCKKEKKRGEIGYVHFTDRTESGKILERRIIRVCRECQEKEWAKPIKTK